ncbi:hypothetical protein HDV00_010388 [Rhizophlyctis rosea]|nr:hypothetical protein HDV00_010388 [Rhizophlyctis rosea]
MDLERRISTIGVDETVDIEILVGLHRKLVEEMERVRRGIEGEGGGVQDGTFGAEGSFSEASEVVEKRDVAVGGDEPLWEWRGVQEGGGGKGVDGADIDEVIVPTGDSGNVEPPTDLKFGDKEVNTEAKGEDALQRDSNQDIDEDNTIPALEPIELHADSDQLQETTEDQTPPDEDETSHTKTTTEDITPDTGQQSSTPTSPHSPRTPPNDDEEGIQFVAQIRRAVAREYLQNLWIHAFYIGFILGILMGKAFQYASLTSAGGDKKDGGEKNGRHGSRRNLGGARGWESDSEDGM